MNRETPRPGNGGRWNSNGRGRERGQGRGRGRGGRGPHQNNFNRFPPVKPSIDKDKTVIEEISPQDVDGSCPVVRVAIEGCCHGELEAIYGRLHRHERETGAHPIDLLLCCGDFQSLRNLADIHSIAVPPKYRSMGSFYKYYNGEKVAPYLTIFVSGNHEASQPLNELYYGGWVAPNIYYLGAAGVVNFCGLRIGGIGGIYNQPHYRLGRYEIPPYDRSTLRSVYHVRHLDVYRLLSLSENKSKQQQRSRLDIFVSHDWPQGIEQHGNTEELLQRKPYFRSEIQQNNLGSPPNHELLMALKPKWWFAAHLHVKFKASLKHATFGESCEESLTKKNENVESSQYFHESTKLRPSSTIRAETKKRKAADSNFTAQSNEMVVESETGGGEIMKDEEIVLDANGEGKESTITNFVAPEQATSRCSGPDLTEQMTQFLSLDKCLPRRHFLTIVNLPVQNRVENPKLEYDVEWLSVLRKTHKLSSRSRDPIDLPADYANVDDDEMQWIHERLPSLQIPENFVQTVPVIAKGTSMVKLPHHLPPPLPMMGNPQTDELLRILELDHIITVPYTGSSVGLAVESRNSVEDESRHSVEDENNIDLSDEDQ
ncbi:hypothetical protein ACA910_012798 [Epithemia clementina (nom. ined.)]